MQAVLVMFRNDGERRSFSITREMTVIGRRQDCDLMIPLGEISRKHCRIIRDGDSLRLEDLGSSNGTYLNAQRVQEAILTPGDSIQVGPVVFVLQVDGQPADEELQPITVEATEQQIPVSDDMTPLSPTAQSEADEMPGIEELGSGLQEDDELIALDDADTNSGEAHTDIDADLDEARKAQH